MRVDDTMRDGVIAIAEAAAAKINAHLPDQDARAPPELADMTISHLYDGPGRRTRQTLRIGVVAHGIVLLAWIT